MENCSFCGKLTDPSLENCPHCGGPMRTQSAAQAPAQAGQRCPSCGGAVQDGDIICVRCGTNLLTGHKIGQEQHREAARPSPSMLPRLFIGAAVLLVLCGLGGLIYFLTLDPVASALALAREGNSLQAIEAMQGYVESHPEHADAWILLGRLYWKTQQRAQAAHAFREASIARPEEANLALFSVLAAGAGAKGEARSQQMQTLDRLLKDHPENPRAWYLSGLLKSGAEDYAGAEAAFKEALRIAPNQEGLQESIGISQALGGNMDQAAVSLRDAAGDGGDRAAAQGFVAQLRGESERAAAFLESALAEKATIADHVRTRLALLYMEQGRFEEALPLLRQVKEADESNATAVFYHALCLEASGLEPEALIAYDRLVGAGKAYAGAAAVQMAGLYLAQANPDRASEMLRRALQLDGPSAHLNTIDGRIRFLQEDYAGAQKAFNEAIRLDPNYAPAQLERGLLYISENNLADGIRALKQYLKLVQADMDGAKINEIELLVNQLQQAIDSEGSRSAPPAAL